MAVEVAVPQAGESITEVVVAEWLVEEGAWVAVDTPLVVLETDKADQELPAPVSGYVREVLKAAEEVANVGEVIARMEEAAAPEGGAAAPAPAAAPAAEPAPAAASGGDGAVMPAAERLLAEHGLKASEVTATGPGGRLLKEDVQRHVAGKSAAPAAAPAATPAPAPASPAPPAPKVVSGQPGREEEVVKMTRLRRKIAERLVEAQQNAAILSTFNEVDMSAVMAMRKRRQEAFVAKHGIKLGFMSFFVKAAVEALKAFPAINAEIRGDDVVYRNYNDIGVAVGGGKGLVVPVIRNAELLSFAEIELTIADFGRRAKSGDLSVDELTGGTFTISNGGVYGSLLSTPILNPPQSGILGMHAIQQRPVGVNGEIVLRPMMYVALSYDHRLVDGREAVSFLKRIKECVEEPERILIDA
ncbi:MAG: 2-oxoglutarate dehydrogenase complex dihydrolipoyllysine-residue succinyltransferase [Acidobacteriota bacterium]